MQDLITYVLIAASIAYALRGIAGVFARPKHNGSFRCNGCTACQLHNRMIAGKPDRKNHTGIFSNS